MKKSAFFIFLCLISFSCFAQSQEEKGATTSDTIFDLPPPFSVHVYDSSKVSGYYLFHVKAEGMSFPFNT